MPTIETYSSGGVTQYQRADSRDFVDTRGTELMAQSLGEASKTMVDIKAKMDQVKDTENRLLMARRLAEGKQKWMVELDKKKQAIEAGQMDYRGLTDGFNEEYSVWSEQIAAEFDDPKVAEEMRVNLIEMQTPLMGSAMDYEARKRAEKIRENYDASTAPMLFAIANSKDRSELVNNVAGLEVITKALPTELAQDFRNKVSNVVVQKEYDLAETPADVKAVTEKVKSGGVYKMSNADALQLANAAEHAINRIVVQYDKEIGRQMSAADELAKSGSLEVGWTIEINSRLNELVQSGAIDSSAREDALQNIVFIEAKNAVASDIWGMSNADFFAYQSELNQKAASTNDVVEKQKISEQLQFATVVKQERDKQLSTNFVGYAFNKAPNVQSAYQQFASLSESGDQDGAVQSFQKYIDEVDAYAASINWDRPIGYLPANEIDKISQDLNKSITTVNGVTEFSDKLAQYKTLYGPKFRDVMAQLRDKNEEFAVMSMIPRIQSNGGNAQAAKNLVVNALRAKVETPDVFNTPDKDIVISDSDTLNKIKTLSINNMNTEINDRAKTYSLVAKHLISQGDPKAKEKAIDLAYGDIEVTGDVVFPLSVGNPDELIYRANSFAVSREATEGVIYPLGSTDESKKDFSNNIDKYITWKNHGASSIVAVWRDTNEPVYKEDGNLLTYSWDDYSISKTKWRVNQGYGQGRSDKRGPK